MIQGATQWETKSIDKRKRMFGRSRLANAREGTLCKSIICAHLIIVSTCWTIKPHRSPIVFGYGPIESLGMFGQDQFGDRRSWDVSWFMRPGSSCSLSVWANNKPFVSLTIRAHTLPFVHRDTNLFCSYIWHRSCTKFGKLCPQRLSRAL